MRTQRVGRVDAVQRFQWLTQKFNIDKSYFSRYLVNVVDYEAKAAQTKIRRLYNGSYPRDDKHIVDAIHARVPYGFSTSEVQNYLRGAEVDRQDLVGRVKQIEGPYELVRYHSAENALVREYFDIKNGTIEYRNYNIHGPSKHYRGPLSSFGNHIQFSGTADHDTEMIFAIFERTPFRKNFFAGMLVGVSDDGIDIVSCKTIARKMRVHAGKELTPGIASFTRVRRRRYETLSSHGDGQGLAEHFFAFSSGVVRKQRRISAKNQGD